jgi:hypothetical protein
MLSLRFTIIVLWLSILSACSPPLQSAAPQVMSLEVAAAPEISGEALARVTDGTQPLQSFTDRIILRDASLSLVVSDPAQTVAEITAIAAETGGWVVNSTTTTSTLDSSGEVTSASITIRVPADRLDEILERIKVASVSILSENVRGRDVTQEYTDLTSQLNNLRAAEEQLQRIMETAETTEEVLAVYRELVRIRGEIETAEGRIRFFDESAAFSSVTVELRAEQTQSPLASAVGWDPLSTASSGLGLLVTILRGIVDVIILAVVVGLPMGLIIGIPVWMAYRLFKRRRIRQAAA